MQQIPNVEIEIEIDIDYPPKSPLEGETRMKQNERLISTMKTMATDRWRYRKTPQMHNHNEDEVGYHALVAAIIRQAILDYQYAESVIQNNRIVDRAYDYRIAIMPDQTKREVIRFFEGDWYATICDIDPKYILKKLGAI